MVKADPKDISPEERKDKLHKLAGSIAHSLEENKEVVIRAFGNSCQGKTAKAIAVARTYVSSRGFDLYFYPRFIVANMNGNERTGMGWCCRTNEG
jgi:stage V sporulation protein SpoVS